MSVAVMMISHHDCHMVFLPGFRFEPGEMSPELGLARNIKACIMSAGNLEDHDGFFKVGDSHQLFRYDLEAFLQQQRINFR